MNKLNIQYLAEDYAWWIKQYGDGRSNLGFRFGQFIFNKYSFEFDQSYFVESATSAYKLLLRGLKAKNK
jgi:hypothetical protein